MTKSVHESIKQSSSEDAHFDSLSMTSNYRERSGSSNITSFQTNASKNGRAFQPNDKARPPSLLKHILTKGSTHPLLPDSDGKVPEGITHDGNNASIITDEDLSKETPWTPRSLVRAKSAIIYKQTLNDTLLVLERNIFFFTDWTPYFLSLQEDFILLFKSREKWEQGIKPDRIIELNANMMLSEMKVDVVSTDTSSGTSRLFRRKILETDQLDQWLNDELRQSQVVDSGSVVDGILLNNPDASAHCLIEFASYSQSTFELWSKTIRRLLQLKRDQYVNENSHDERTRTEIAIDDELSNNSDIPSPIRRASSSSESHAPKSWVSPGHDSKLTLHQSEIWCNRMLSGEKEKAESEMRRIVAMEKLVNQVTSPRMALLVYEKVSRVHELFIANSRREIERIDQRDQPITPEVLNFFADHLKRKYSVFLILALAYGVGEEQIREAHEVMCEENSAVNAGVGGGVAEQQRSASCYGFEDPESLELYEKYRDAAVNYFKMNYGDPSAAEEEDAIMHLPVMLQVAVVRQDAEEARAMLSIMDTVKARLMNYCDDEDNNES